MSQYKTPTHKVCSNCKIDKPASAYVVFKKGKYKGRLYWHCKDCNKHYNKATYQRKSIDWRASDLRKKFGLTLEAYTKILEAQNGVCAICRQPETATRNGRALNLAVDHDHVTGKIRGLLCGCCNTSLGGFKDNPLILSNAIAYLKMAASQSAL